MRIWLCCTRYLHLPVQVRSSSISVCFQRLCVSRFSECRRRDVCTLASLVWCHLCMWPGSFWTFPFLDYLVVGQDSGGQCHWFCGLLGKSHCQQLIFFLFGSRLNSHLCFVMPRGRFHDVHQSVVQRQQWGFLLRLLFFHSCCSRCCSRKSHLARRCCPSSCPSTSLVMPFLPCHSWLLNLPRLPYWTTKHSALSRNSNISPMSLRFFSIEDLPTIPFKKFQYIFYLDILKFNSTFQKNKTFSSSKKFRSFFHCYCVFFSIEDLPTIPLKKFQYISYLDILKFNSTFQKNKR